MIRWAENSMAAIFYKSIIGAKLAQPSLKYSFS
jgi:hypothetical protein